MNLAVLLLFLTAPVPPLPPEPTAQDATTRFARVDFVLSDLALEAVAASCSDDDAYEPDDTPRSDRPLARGETQTHRLCDPDWMRIPAPAFTTWVIEARDLDGLGDTVLELYEKNVGPSGSGAYTRTARALTSTASGIATLTVRLRSADPYLGVFAADSAYGPGKGYEVTARRLPCCPGEGGGRPLLLPAVFQGPGDGRPALATDVLLSNPGFSPVDAELLLSRPAGARLSHAVRLAAGATLELRHVLASTFGIDAGEGAIEVRPSGPLLASTVLRNSGGQVLGIYRAEPLESGIASGERAHLVHLDGRPPAGVSIGLVETAGAPATVTLRILDASGAARSERVLELPPNGYVPVDIPEAAGLGAGVRATVETAGAGRVQSYSLVTESGGAGALLSLHRTRGGESAHARPALVTVEPVTVEPRVTDVRVVNIGNELVDVELSLDSLSIPSPRSFLDPGRTLVLDDALSSRDYRREGVLRTSSPDLLVSARGRRAEMRAAQSPPLVPSDRPDPASHGTGRGRVSILLPPGTRYLFLLADQGLYESLTLTVSIVGPDGRTNGAADVPLLDRLGSSYPSLCSSGACTLVSADVLATLGSLQAASRLDVEVPGMWLRLSARAIVDGSEAEHFLQPVPLGEGLETLTVALPGVEHLVLKRVPAGRFQMGSPAAENGRDADEEVHLVTITQPYLIAEKELTERQWDAVMGNGGERGERPVGEVSWESIASPGGFLDRLNASTLGGGRPEGTLFRLPTEAEWEKAARAGTTTSFPFSVPCDIHTCKPCTANWLPWSCGGTTTEPFPTDARSFDLYTTPGPLGLHDMQGNVWEWVQDFYAPFGAAPQIDPLGPIEGELRVIRGGSYLSTLKLCRSANRYPYPASAAYPDVGFRVVLAPLK